MTLKTGRALGFAAALLLGGLACSANNQVGTDDGKGGAAGDELIGEGGATATGIQGKGGALGMAVEAWGLSADATVGQLAVATSSKAAPFTVLDAHDGATVRVLKPTPLLIGTVGVRQAAGFIAVGDLGTVWIFKADGAQLRAIPQASLGDLSRDGKVLVSSGAGGVRRFDVATGAEILPLLQGPPVADAEVERFGPVAISPDGAHVASYGTNGVYVWNTRDGGRRAQLLTSGQVALSGTELAVGNGATVTVYTLTGQMLSQYPAPGPAFVAYSADGTKLAYTTQVASDIWAGATLVKIVDRPSGVELASLFEDRQGRSQPNRGSVIPRGLVFIGDAVACLWSDRRVTLFSASDGVPIWSRVLDE
jgi:hypothetical protein